MSVLHHECGLAAVYHLPGERSPLCPEPGREEASRLMPRMLLDVQNRGQLSCGMTTYNPARNQLLETYKDVGTVSEVFRLSHRGKAESLMKEYAGCAAIGHTRYATCGADDRSYAQPFEREHLQKSKWFSFAFNGQLANYATLREEMLAAGDSHLSRDNDTEIILHAISRRLSRETTSNLAELFRDVTADFDGAYNIVYLNAHGDMGVLRDPLGIRPLCYAKEGALFAASSESVGLLNLGFHSESIKSLAPGELISIVDGKFEIQRYAASPRRAHCFFEWIYFANVASTMDGHGVYLSRKRLGEELAALEDIPIDENTIVVPVPDTSKAAADSMAYKLKIPSLEGLIRNRYSGRTFIEGGVTRKQKVDTKYTPLREILEGKKIFLVEDSIVRSTTMKSLLHRIRTAGGAKEIHVRVACPPIVSPCFYGIDMSTIGELFAPPFMRDGRLTDAAQRAMAEKLGADTLRYLPVESIARAVGFDARDLCQACITGEYPTQTGRDLYQIALQNTGVAHNGNRTYESLPLVKDGV
ncbi:MAG: amidophosphoribosyltransferase [Pirellulales bacterium]